MLDGFVGHNRPSQNILHQRLILVGVAHLPDDFERRRIILLPGQDFKTHHGQKISRALRRRLGHLIQGAHGGVPILFLHGRLQFGHERLEQGLLLLFGGRRFPGVVGSGQDTLDGFFLQGHGMPDPGDVAGGVNQKSRGDAVLACRRHPRLGHWALFASLFVIQRHAIGHAVAHGLDEGGDLAFVRLPAILSDNDQALVLEFGVNFIEMRDGSQTRPIPGGPELDDISLARREFLDRVALHELAGLQFGRRVPHVEAGGGSRQNQAGGQRQHAGEKMAMDIFHISSTGAKLLSHWGTRIDQAGAVGKACATSFALSLRPSWRDGLSA